MERLLPSRMTLVLYMDSSFCTNFVARPSEINSPLAMSLASCASLSAVFRRISLKKQHYCVLQLLITLRQQLLITLRISASNLICHK